MRIVAGLCVLFVGCLGAECAWADLSRVEDIEVNVFAKTHTRNIVVANGVLTVSRAVKGETVFSHSERLGPGLLAVLDRLVSDCVEDRWSWRPTRDEPMLNLWVRMRDYGGQPRAAGVDPDYGTVGALVDWLVKLEVRASRRVVEEQYLERLEAGLRRDLAKRLAEEGPGSALASYLSDRVQCAGWERPFHSPLKLWTYLKGRLANASGAKAAETLLQSFLAARGAFDHLVPVGLAPARSHSGGRALNVREAQVAGRVFEEAAGFTAPTEPAARPGILERVGS